MSDLVTIFSPYSPNPITVTLTNDIYKASLAPEVLALMESPNISVAQQLAASGHTIDTPIMLWGYDPTSIMVQRVVDGYTWVPSALQPPLTSGPGINFPGAMPYNPALAPPGSIKVSVNANDFPPFSPPMPVVPVVPNTNKVGAEVPGDPGVFFAGPGAMINSLTPAVTDGEGVSQGGVMYIAHVTQGMFAWNVTFTKS